MGAHGQGLGKVHPFTEGDIDLIDGSIPVVLEMDELDPAVRFLKGRPGIPRGSPFPKREPITTFSRTVIPGKGLTI